MSVTTTLGPGTLADDGCSVLHVDMDAFYVAVELRDRPDLVGCPVIVGGGSRGVVLSASYEARQRGVHAPLPMTRARRLCPEGVFLTPRFEEYSAASTGVMEIFRSITPVVEPLSGDEAFLDVAGSRRRLGSPAQIGEQIRRAVATEQGITCSVGVAAAKFIAKLASSSAKPDGMRVVRPQDELAFLHPLPVGALWGVGAKTEEQLQRFGLRTVADLASISKGTLIRILGHESGARLSDLAHGRAHPRDPVRPVRQERSLGSQETFGRDVDDPVVLRRELLRLATRVARRMRRARVHGRTVVLTVRFADFSTITRSRRLRSTTDVAEEIYIEACSLLDALGLVRARVRLVGIRMQGLVDQEHAERQMMLGEPDAGRRHAECAADRVIDRFGSSAVQPASLL
jgi:DNA polymerase-4